MKSTGLVLSERAYVGSASPPDTFEDESRAGNDGVHTDVTWVQLPTGLWVRRFNGSTSVVTCGSLTLGKHTFEFWLNSSHSSGNVGIFGFSASAWQSFSLVGLQPIIHLDAGGANYQYWNDVSALYLDGAWHFWELYIAGSGINDIDDCSLKIDGNTIAKAVKIKTGAPDAWTEFTIGHSGYGNIAADISLVKGQNYARSAGQGKKTLESERHWFGV